MLINPRQTNTMFENLCLHIVFQRNIFEQIRGIKWGMQLLKTFWLHDLVKLVFIPFTLSGLAFLLASKLNSFVNNLSSTQP